MQITDQLKKRIYKDYWEKKESPKDLSKKYNVSLTDIYKILKEDPTKNSPFKIFKTNLNSIGEVNSIKKDYESRIKKLEKENNTLKDEIETYKAMCHNLKQHISFLEDKIQKYESDESLENRDKHKRKFY